MRFDQLEIENIRRFERFACVFDPAFTVIAGENGKGKTTILEILGKSLSKWILHEGEIISSNDKRVKLSVVDGFPYKKPFHPNIFKLSGFYADGEQFIFSLNAKLEEARSNIARIISYFHSLSDDKCLPLVALFTPWRGDVKYNKSSLSIVSPSARIEGYDGALDLHASLTSFASWLKTRDLAAVQEQRTAPVVEAARRAVVRCLPGYRDIRYMIGFNDVMVQRDDGEYEPVWQLSDGYRTMVALVGELAWRAAILNPMLGEDAPLKVSGVVLIDELDLHLHPNWQRRIAADLQAAFPKVQFICTSHSPFILQSLRPEQVINLDREAPMDFQASSIEDIAEEAMGVSQPQRSRIFHEKTEAARRWLLAVREARVPEEVARLRQEYDRLLVRYGDDPVFVAALRQKLAATGLDPGDPEGRG